MADIRMPVTVSIDEEMVRRVCEKYEEDIRADERERIAASEIPGPTEAYERGYDDGAAKERERILAALANSTETLYTFGGQDVEAVGWDAIESLLEQPAAIGRGEHKEAPDAM